MSIYDDKHVTYLIEESFNTSEGNGILDYIDRLKANVKNAAEANAANVCLIDIWKERAERAEARIRDLNKVFATQEEAIEQAEAESARLRVCGTCGHHDGHWNGCLNKGWPRGDKDDDGLFADSDPCHFDPPRYKPYWEES